MALDPRFEISIAKDEEMDGVMRLIEKAFGNDEIWKYTTEHCDPEEVHEWIMTNLTQRWLMPDITTYKVTEVATG
jgi:macrodomain Ter protein organizer (MatP/YcbG family)